MVRPLMPADLPGLVADLAAETAGLDAILAPLSAKEWRTPTPADGWTIADQVSHLTFFDEAATRSATDPERFLAQTAELTALGGDFPDQVAARYRHLTAKELLEWFRRARAEYLATFGAIDPAARLPWYGPDMSPASSVTARLMETWAHGLDITDALGITAKPTARLRHIAHLGVRTMGFSFALRGLPAPERPVRVDLTAPDGTAWTWGPPDAADRVTGPALDFCLVVTQRRHRADTSLRATGPVAGQWLDIAQAFAGPPGPGRRPQGKPSPRATP
jgi:uncharacterized protein (TIGR03084 family)